MLIRGNKHLNLNKLVTIKTLENWRFLKSNKCSPSINIFTNEWFHYFSNLFNPNIESDTEYAFDEEAMIILDEIFDEPITASEIRASVTNLKNGQSPGIDGIPAEFFKVACGKFLPFLEIMFNKLYNNSYFPNDWSISIITLIPKKGDKNIPDNYRGISLQPVISKIYTTILNKRSSDWSNENNTLGEEQAGYRIRIQPLIIYFVFKQ